MIAARGAGPLRLLSVQAASPGRGSLPVETFARLLRLVFDSPLGAKGFRLAWQSGEPLSLPLDRFAQYLDALKGENRAQVSVQIELHTDAAAIDAAWIELFKTNDVQLHVRFDGPEGPRSGSGRDWCGRNVSDLTQRGIARLREAGLPFTIDATLRPDSLAHGRDLLPYFAKLGARSVGFAMAEDTADLPGIDRRMDRFWRDVVSSASELPSELPVREVDAALLRLAGDENALDDQRVPLRIVACDWQGRLATFSPNLMGAHAPAYGDFVFATVDGLTRLEDMLSSLALRRCRAEIAAGAAACRKSCPYFNACGGGAPWGKFREHGHLRGTETLECRLSIQAPTRLSLALAQATLPLAESWLTGLPI